MTDYARDIDNLRTMLDTARGVMRSPAFVEWRRQIEGQISARNNELLEPVSSQDLLVKQEYMKGEAVGLMHAVRQWDLMIELLTEDLQKLSSEKGDDEDETGTQQASP